MRRGHQGETCYICTQARHWKTKEGLVRGCACRGRRASARVCLAEEAKILVAEALENNLGSKVLTERFQRWDTCSLCEQDYHGVVRCALGGRANVLGRPEKDQLRAGAMRKLERIIGYKPPRGRVVRKRGRVVHAAAPWRFRINHTHRSEQSCRHLCAWAARVGSEYLSRRLPDMRGSMARNMPPQQRQLRELPFLLQAP